MNLFAGRNARPVHHVPFKVGDRVIDKWHRRPATVVAVNPEAPSFCYTLDEAYPLHYAGQTHGMITGGTVQGEVGFQHWSLLVENV